MYHRHAKRAVFTKLLPLPIESFTATGPEIVIMFARSMFRTARISIRGFATAAKAQEARPYYWTSAAFVGVASATYLAFNHNVVSAEWFAKDAPKALNDPNEWIDLPVSLEPSCTHTDFLARVVCSGDT